MENTGWIKLHRSFLKWEWYNNINTKMLFIHLLLKVNYEDKEWRKVDIPKGSCITSYGNLAKELGLSVQNIRTSIAKLKSTHEITVKSTNKYIVITLENWEKYQYGEVKINTQTNNETNSKLTTTKETVQTKEQEITRLQGINQQFFLKLTEQDNNSQTFKNNQQRQQSNIDNSLSINDLVNKIIK